MNIPRTFWRLGERGYLLDSGWFEVLGKFDMSLLRGAGRMRKVDVCPLDDRKYDAKNDDAGLVDRRLYS